MPQPTRVALMLTLLFAGSTARLAGQETANPYTSRIDVRMGGNLYRSKCTSCHGIDGRGSEEGDGPDLTTGRFQHADTDAGLFRVIRDGIADTSMRANAAPATRSAVEVDVGGPISPPSGSGARPTSFAPPSATRTPRSCPAGGRCGSPATTAR